YTTLFRSDEAVLRGARELARGLRLGVRAVGLGLDGGLLEVEGLLPLGDLLGSLDDGELGGALGLGLGHLGELPGVGGLGAAEVGEVVRARGGDVGDVEQVDLQALLGEVRLRGLDHTVREALAVRDDLLDRHVADDGAQRALERLLDDLGQQVLLGEEALGGAPHAFLVTTHLEVDRRLDRDLDAVLVHTLDRDADLALLQRDGEALLQHGPHERPTTDHDALARELRLRLPGAAADDDERLVGRHPSDAARDEREDEEDRDDACGDRDDAYDLIGHIDSWMWWSDQDVEVVPAVGWTRAGPRPAGAGLGAGLSAGRARP